MGPAAILVACAPAEPPASQRQSGSTPTVVENPLRNPNPRFVSIPDADVTPNPSPTPYLDNRPLELAPGEIGGSGKPAIGAAQLPAQRTRVPGGPAFRSKKPIGELTVGGNGQPDFPGERAPQEAPTYSWRDGDRTLTVLLQTGLTVKGVGDISPSDDVLVRTAKGGIVEKAAGGRSAGGDDLPVFRTLSGTLMTLPGGILIVLDETWGSAEVSSFFDRNGIEAHRISALDYAINGFFVETDPGFPSLELANALAVQPGVAVSSPNWWREVVAK